MNFFTDKKKRVIIHLVTFYLAKVYMAVSPFFLQFARLDNLVYIYNGNEGLLMKIKHLIMMIEKNIVNFELVTIKICIFIIQAKIKEEKVI